MALLVCQEQGKRRGSALTLPKRREGKGENPCEISFVKRKGTNNAFKTKEQTAQESKSNHLYIPTAPSFVIFHSRTLTILHGPFLPLFLPFSLFLFLLFSWPLRLLLSSKWVLCSESSESSGWSHFWLVRNYFNTSTVAIIDITWFLKQDFWLWRTTIGVQNKCQELN